MVFLSILRTLLKQLISEPASHHMPIFKNLRMYSLNVQRWLKRNRGWSTYLRRDYSKAARLNALSDRRWHWFQAIKSDCRKGFKISISLIINFRSIYGYITLKFIINLQTMHAVSSANKCQLLYPLQLLLIGIRFYKPLFPSLTPQKRHRMEYNWA
jgi:hypothetical protein